MKLLLETLTSGADYLAKRGVEDARLNMEHLLAHVLGCRRLDLYLRFNESLHESDLAPLRALLKRRGEGEPLQHLLGTVEFHGSEFICDGRALIPRPETEHLVSLLMQRFGKSPPARVLDVGTGSGCIGLSLAKSWPGSEVTLSDISEDALELARFNAERLALRPRFMRSDLFEKITGESDFIVANLPYVPDAERATMSPEVQRDPESALYGGADGLDVVRRFIADCPPHLSPGGLIALELAHDQSPAVMSLLHDAHFQSIQADRDLAGVERFVFAQKPSPQDAT